MHLETNNLTKHFGGTIALDDVSLEFPAGQITAVIGSNGAGKTTLFNTIAGFVEPDSGSVRLVREDGGTPVQIDLTSLPPSRIARSGIGVLFQDIRVFGHLTAIENVVVGMQHQWGENPIRTLFMPGAVGRQDRDNLAQAKQHLDFVGLSDKASHWASTLSYGQQKLIALARVLATDASVILLDEPTSGIHPTKIDTLLGLVERLAHDQNKAVIMIEHNLNVVRRVGDWVYLMAGGKAEVFGKPDEVLRDDALIRTYPTL